MPASKQITIAVLVMLIAGAVALGGLLLRNRFQAGNGPAVTPGPAAAEITVTESQEADLPAIDEEEPEPLSEQAVEVSPPAECNALCIEGCGGFANQADTDACLKECEIMCAETVETVQ